MFFLFTYLLKYLEISVRIQSGPAGPVQQIRVSGPVRSGNSYVQSGQALLKTLESFLFFSNLETSQ